MKYGNCKKPKTYTKEILIEKLHQYKKEFGKIPTLTEMNKNPDYPSSVTYRNYFGSWRKGLEAAGLECKWKPQYTDEELISILKKFDEKPTQKMFGDSLPCFRTYVYRFGSWKNALDLAGY